MQNYLVTIHLNTRYEIRKSIVLFLFTSRHDSVSCGPKSRRHTVGILTGRKKTSFSHFCISVIPYPIGTKFATALPASQGSLHTNCEGHGRNFQDTSCQSFDFFLRFFSYSSSCFCTLAKIVIKCKHML